MFDARSAAQDIAVEARAQYAARAPRAQALDARRARKSAAGAYGGAAARAVKRCGAGRRAAVMLRVASEKACEKRR